MIGPDTIEIAYCDGELYDEVMDTIQPVPAHCVWLTEMESRDGTSLLLDVQTGAWGSLETGCFVLDGKESATLDRHVDILHRYRYRVDDYGT